MIGGMPFRIEVRNNHPKAKKEKTKASAEYPTKTVTTENWFGKSKNEGGHCAKSQQKKENREGGMRKIGQQYAGAEYQENPEHGVTLPNHAFELIWAFAVP